MRLRHLRRPMRAASRAARSLDPIDLASIPFFVTTLLLERRSLARRELRPLTAEAQEATTKLVPLGYERNDTTASLLMLVGNVAIGFATLRPLTRLSDAVFRRRISSFGSGRAALVTALVAWDFLYYWDHRIQHRVRFFWANHVSHHSSRRYNLSTALRQPWSGALMSWIFLPMPLFGYSSRTTFRAAQLNLLYQYWIHTETIDRLPRPLEAVLNTPSHHRVHHGTDREHLDTNYGGILIVWDQLFGTFARERRRPTYGLTTNIDTYNPISIAYGEYAALARQVAGSTRWRDRIGFIVRPPGWKPRGGTDRSPILVT